MLKTLSAALHDGDSIYALIRATGVNQDGRTNGITVPNGESQIALLRHVYSKAGISVRTCPISRRTAPAPPSAIRPRRKPSAAVLSEGAGPPTIRA